MSSDADMSATQLTRRAVMGAGAVAGLAATTAVSGCANSGSYDQDPGAGGDGVPTGGLVKLADVPVGGVVAVTVDRVPAFVARPDSDTVRAFSAICTHQGCTVRHRDDRLACPCHGSQFELLTGDVLRGPATAPLPPLDVHTADGYVVAG